MAYKISFNAAAVNTTISSMDAVYDQISEILKDINSKKETISGFWSCAEANNFLTVLASLSTDFTNFEKKYASFKTALNQVISTYEKEEEAYVSKLESTKKVNGTPTNADSGASAGDSSSN
jgi:uncharacterized protein YukE